MCRKSLIFLICMIAGIPVAAQHQHSGGTVSYGPAVKVSTLPAPALK